MTLDEMFETPAKSELAKSHFVNLTKHEGWILFKKIVESNIELLKEQILSGFENETKEMIDRKRDKLQAYREMINTPEDMIAKLSPSKPAEDDTDPFDTVESIQKARLKR